MGDGGGQAKWRRMRWLAGCEVVVVVMVMVVTTMVMMSSDSDQEASTKRGEMSWGVELVTGEVQGEEDYCEYEVPSRRLTPDSSSDNAPLNSEPSCPSRDTRRVLLVEAVEEASAKSAAAAACAGRASRRARYQGIVMKVRLEMKVRLDR